MKNLYWILIGLFFCISCKKTDEIVTYDEVRSIKINNNITIDNGVTIHDPIFNYNTYEQFLKYLVTSNRFLIVQQKDFNSTTSTDKVVLSIRHDIDDNINSAVKFAYREQKYGIKTTYFVLHTAPYYGVTREKYFKRNDQVKDYLLRIQNWGHEIGFHNDLVTLQVVYSLSPKQFLKDELTWLRGNGLVITGSTSHGSNYCYTYHYVNSYFWEGITGDPNGNFYNWEVVPKDNELITLEKDKPSNYDLDYEGYDLISDYFFADCFFPNGKRWNMSMVNWDTIQPGKKVIILLHSQHWD